MGDPRREHGTFNGLPHLSGGTGERPHRLFITHINGAVAERGVAVGGE